ncbi:MAG: ral secretion family protein [Dehalococcoidia bacterium]|nr:ral secretion family protein [Dehalococcoidia bacterium]
MVKRMLKRFHKSEGGFTLVELLVVIAILAILVAVVVPNFTGLISKGTTEANSAEKRTIQTVVDTYMADSRISTLGATGTITPANYATSIAANYLRTAPKCNYSYTTTGLSTQDSCP